MTTPAMILAVGLALALAMAVAWRVALATGRSGWIDATWSLSAGAAGAALALAPGGEAHLARQLLVAALAAGWSLRLAIYIGLRTISGGDDPRYAHLRTEWGGSYPIKLFGLLQLQALVALVLALAVGLAAHRPGPALDAMDALGMILFAVAVAGETVADGQLAAFRADPLNRWRVCDRGLWGLARHPNYLFECLAWLGLAAIAIDLHGDYPQGWLALAAPALMCWLLAHVSGVPPLEAHMLRSRGDAYRAYQARVPAFWPRLPRRHSSDDASSCAGNTSRELPP